MTRYRVEPDPNGYGFEVIAPDGRHVARARTCADATKLADGYEANVKLAQRNRQTRLTREWAIAQLVERDVARWGEQERTASQQMRGRLSHGLALNALAHYDVDDIDDELAREAKRVMTAQDWHHLRGS